jgi:hypothetical protein
MAFDLSDWAPASDYTNDAAADAAQATADAAKSTADALATMIRQDADGITVGKSADGTTYANGTSVTRQGTDGTFSILKALSGALTTVASFGEKLIELGKSSTSAVIKFCAGNGEIGFITGSNQLYLSGTNGAYLARQIDIDDGSDFGIGLADDNGKAKAVLNADEFEVAGQLLTWAQMETLLSDTGWTWLANYGNGHGVRWRCVGGTVYVQVAIYGERKVGRGEWYAGTIPAGYRPSADVAVAGVSFGALTNPTQLKVLSNGNVSLWAPSDTTYFGGSLSYPLEA